MPGQSVVDEYQYWRVYVELGATRESKHFFFLKNGNTLCVPYRSDYYLPILWQYCIHGMCFFSSIKHHTEELNVLHASVNNSIQMWSDAKVHLPLGIQKPWAACHCDWSSVPKEEPGLMGRKQSCCCLCANCNQTKPPSLSSTAMPLQRPVG